MSKATQVPSQTEEDSKQKDVKKSEDLQSPLPEIQEKAKLPLEGETFKGDEEEMISIKADGKTVKVPAKATLINLLKSTGGPKSLSHAFEEVGSHAPHGWVWNDEVLESKRPGQLIDLYQQMQAFNNE